MGRVTTAYLLTCAAIGVAGGIMLWGAGWASSVLTPIAPIAAMTLSGLWLLPATIALRLLQRPLAGILTGVLSGLVVFPFLGAAVWWAFFAELGFLLVLYRWWSIWQHFAGALVVGIVYPILSAEFFNLWSMPTWAQIAFFAVTLISCLGGTALGIVIADRLRAAGVAKLARRRGNAARGLGRGAGPAGQH